MGLYQILLSRQVSLTWCLYTVPGSMTVEGSLWYPEGMNGDFTFIPTNLWAPLIVIRMWNVRQGGKDSSLPWVHRAPGLGPNQFNRAVSLLGSLCEAMWEVDFGSQYHGDSVGPGILAVICGSWIAPLWAATYAFLLFWTIVAARQRHWETSGIKILHNILHHTLIFTQGEHLGKMCLRTHILWNA
jgi:hypothetical protein